MILSTVHRRKILTNVLSYMSKFSQPACYTSTVSARYPDYYLVYQFPHIHAASVVNRLKMYQTIVTTSTIPISMALFQLDLVDAESINTFLSAGLAGCGLLYFTGFFGQNTIAFIYLHKSNDNVKIAYCNFWGRRVDIDVPPEDIVPSTETATRFTDQIYDNFYRYSTKKSLKLYLKHGGIVDTERFNHIFGKPVS